MADDKNPGKNWFQEQAERFTNAAGSTLYGASEAIFGNTNLIDAGAKFLQGWGNVAGRGEYAAEPSVGPKSINVGGADPIQGFDVGVFVFDPGMGHQTLLGQFTSIEIIVKVASEPYKAVGHNIPIYLDGEMQISFTLEKGLIDMNVFEQTFGFSTLSYKNSYFRTPRFEISFAVDPVDGYALSQPTRYLGPLILTEDQLRSNARETHQVFNDQTIMQRTPSGKFILKGAKIDEWGLGSRAGRQVVINQWKGVAQEISTELKSHGSFDDYDTTNPENMKTGNVPTFYFGGFADFASTSVRDQMKSYNAYPDWLTPETMLRLEKQLLMGGASGFNQALLDAINRQLEASGNDKKSMAIGDPDAIVDPQVNSKAINKESYASKSAFLADIWNKFQNSESGSAEQAYWASIFTQMNPTQTTSVSVGNPDAIVDPQISSKAINQERYASQSAALADVWNKFQNSEPGSAEEAHWASVFTQMNPPPSIAVGDSSAVVSKSPPSSAKGTPDKIVDPMRPSWHDKDTEPKGIDTFSKEPILYNGGVQIDYQQSKAINQTFSKAHENTSSALQDAQGNPMTKVPVLNEDGTPQKNEDGTPKTQIVPVPVQNDPKSRSTNQTVKSASDPKSIAKNQSNPVVDDPKSKAINQTFRPFITKTSYAKDNGGS